MLKLAKKESPETRKLVLGFDAGCFTCVEMARRVEEKVGDKVEIQNLNDPRLLEWRKEALGEDAPWAPTLFEVKGEKVRAWTGKRMGLQLTRFLGPVATWRVMQVLGEVGAETELVEESPVAKAVTGMSRGQFLKGLGGAVVAMSVLSGTGNLASPVEAASRKVELKGDRLAKVAKIILKRRDLKNVMGGKWCNRVRSSRHIRICQNGDCVTVVGYGNGRCSVKRVNGKTTVSGDCAIVRAARHRLKNGRRLLAITYATGNRVAIYYSYDKSFKRVKSEATLWKGDGRKNALIAKASHNGALDSPKPRSSSSSNSITAASHDPCGGCGAPGDLYDYYLGRKCSNINWRCAGQACGTCGWVCWSSHPLVCLACVGYWCPFWLAICCDRWVGDCRACGYAR